MALVSLNGSTTTPAPTQNSYVEVQVPILPTLDQKKVDEGPARNSLVSDSVLDINRYWPIIGALRRYVEGKPVRVTYYRKMVDSTLRTSDGDADPTSIHNTYTRITDFELRADADFSFSYIEDENISQYTGTLTMYPGMIPRIGDFFLFILDAATGTVGRFKVNSVQRLSIMSHACHRIAVELVDYMNQDAIDLLEKQVVKVMHFHIDAYLDGKQILLQTSDKAMLHDIDTCLRILKTNYTQNFFNNTLKAFVRPDGVYDPYIAEFLLNLITFDTLNCYPKKFTVSMPYENKSYWKHLSDPDMVLPNEVIGYHTKYFVPKMDEFSTNINSLVGRPLVQLCLETDEEAEPYLSDGLASIDPEDQTEFDRLVRLFLEQSKIDPLLLLTLSQTYRNWSLMDQFYKVPVLMFKLLILKQILLTGRGETQFANALDYSPVEREFTAENLQDEYLVISAENKAIGIIDDLGDQWLLADGEINYLNNYIQINLKSIYLRYRGTLYFRDTAPQHVGNWEADTNLLTLNSQVNVEVGMAVQAGNGIPEKTYITAVLPDGEVTISNDTTEAGEDVTLLIDYPVFQDTWKVILTGNLVLSGHGAISITHQQPVTFTSTW